MASYSWYRWSYGYSVGPVGTAGIAVGGSISVGTVGIAVGGSISAGIRLV